jgi:hypothetical protein
MAPEWNGFDDEERIDEPLEDDRTDDDALRSPVTERAERRAEDHLTDHGSAAIDHRRERA